MTLSKWTLTANTSSLNMKDEVRILPRFLTHGYSGIATTQEGSAGRERFLQMLVKMRREEKVTEPLDGCEKAYPR